MDKTTKLVSFAKILAAENPLQRVIEIIGDPHFKCIESICFKNTSGGINLFGVCLNNQEEKTLILSDETGAGLVFDKDESKKLTVMLNNHFE